MQAPATIADRIAASGLPSESAITANVTPELRHTSAAEAAPAAHAVRGGRADQTAPHPPAEVEEGERRHEDAEEDGEPAEPGNRPAVDAPPLGPGDDAEEPRHAAAGR